MSKKNKKIGLFFGSFNPVHTGHMIIANHIVEESDLDQIWLVVSPQNPFKTKKSLAPEYERLHMVHLAIGDNIRMRGSKIEFDLPKPSYTIDTLTFLKEKHPNYEFTLLMGGDNLANFHKWKNYKKILEHYHIIVYRRPGYDPGDLADHPKVTILDAPLLELSASMIRHKIKEGKSIQYFVPQAVFEYLNGSSLYKKD